MREEDEEDEEEGPAAVDAGHIRAGGVPTPVAPGTLLEAVSRPMEADLRPIWAAF